MPKGVSAAQKKDFMVAMFQESLDVLTEKEVEKRAPKKGIIASAAKDTLKEVVDDDLVLKDKVGVSWYFWSFPSDKQAKDQAQLAALRRDAAKQEGQLQALRAQQAAAAAAAGPADDGAKVAEAEAELERLRERRRAVQREEQALEAEKAIDLHARKKDVVVLRDAANRWTDNIHEIKKVCVDKFGMEKERFEKGFEIGEKDLEYVV